MKISSLEIIDEQTTCLNSTYIQLNWQFSRIVIDFWLAQLKAYCDYEHDEKISQANHRQLEIVYPPIGRGERTENAFRTNAFVRNAIWLRSRRPGHVWFR
jgi:hypothetical protein